MTDEEYENAADFLANETNRDEKEFEPDDDVEYPPLESLDSVAMESNCDNLFRAATEIDGIREEIEHGTLQMSTDLAQKNVEKMDEILADLQSTMRELAINEEVISDDDS